MPKCSVRFYRLSDPPPLSPAPLVEIEPLRVVVMSEPDKSDPFNQLLVVSFKIGNRCGATATVERGPNVPPADLATAISGLLTAAIENAAEIRDAIAMEKAG